MKTIRNIIILSLFALSAARCSFLDVENYTRDMQQYDSIFLKETTTKQWLWNVYSSLTDAPAFNSGGTFYASDEMVWNDSEQACQKYHNCQYSSSNQLWEDRYAKMYIGIRTASIFIHNVAKCREVSQTEREHMEGEARFLRAYFYYTLLKQYGPVPVVPDEGQDISLDYNELAIPRASMDECVDFIVTDLERAARILPTEYASTWIGRATRGAALALRAKVLLYAASPLFNGNTDLFNLKDNEGRTLIPQEYDEVIDMNLYTLFTVRKSDDTVPLADNVPTANFPNGAGDIDPYESYAQLFNGETPLTLNNEFIFMRQGGTADVNFFVGRAFPYSHKGSNDMAATLKQVDAYYMRDGRDKDQASEEYPYYTEGFTDGSTNDPFVPSDCHRMWLNREPRFYASIAYNGCIWENGTADQSLQNFRCNYYRAGQEILQPRRFVGHGRPHDLQTAARNPLCRCAAVVRRSAQRNTGGCRIHVQQRHHGPAHRGQARRGRDAQGIQPDPLPGRTARPLGCRIRIGRHIPRQDQARTPHRVLHGGHTLLRRAQVERRRDRRKRTHHGPERRYEGIRHAEGAVLHADPDADIESLHGQNVPLAVQRCRTAAEYETHTEPGMVGSTEFPIKKATT